MGLTKITNQEDICELRQEIVLHIQAIESSYEWYRTEAKHQKVAVLEACLNYLDSHKVTDRITNKARRMELDDLKNVIDSHPKYKDCLAKSSTKNLVNIVLNLNSSLIKERLDLIDAKYMTPKGYYCFPSNTHPS
ncbi:hypothetical protein ACNVED_08430 [Legionella sp. D16C41]|uniref:hypothetical protein n=1 Tax=Legionella sp. D16C41 TaxID=3402688 RepID=UPI003AF4971B